MKTVILCEKPDMALNIAKALGEYKKSNGYYIAKDYNITYAFGHLAELASPLSYIDKDRIEYSDLPILPEKFKIKVVDSKKKQYYIIRSLFLEADQIINATDAGREGELIFGYIYQLAGTSKPVKRLWLKSLTKKGILKGFENLIPGEEKKLLMESARARAIADWLVGLNASIAFSYQAKLGKPLSLGRVQTPTLKMVTERYKEVKGFVKKPIFSPFIFVKPNDASKEPLKAFLNKNFKDVPKPELLAEINYKIQCISADTKERIEKSPLPFDLPSLQQKASQLFSFSAKKTGQVMQELYEKHKVLTYPRTDSRYITEDVFEEVDGTLTQLISYNNTFDKHIEYLKVATLEKNCVNDNNVTDHHAIIPTGIIPKDLNQDQEKIFDLVFKQFLAAFYPSCIKDVTNYNFANNSESPNKYVLNGVVVRSLGWRTVLGNSKEILLPIFEKNNNYDVVNKGVEKTFSKPKSYFTDGTLISAMTGAGKEFDSDYDIPKDVKANGIGKQGTRDQIIENLLNKGYIKRDTKYLIPTNIGIQTIDVLQQSLITSVQLTGQWENSLERILNNELSFNKFITNVKLFTTKIVEEIKTLDITFKEDKYPCPKCKKKTVANRKVTFNCLNDDCDFRLWKKISSKTISDSILIELLITNKTKTIKGFTSMKEKKFDAALQFEEGKLKFIFNTEKFLSKTYSCPKCKKGEIKENNKSVYCSDYKNGCNFSIWKVMFNKKLKPSEVELILNGKTTKKLDGFISKKKTKFSAAIALDNDFKTTLIF